MALIGKQGVVDVAQIRCCVLRKSDKGDPLNQAVWVAAKATVEGQTWGWIAKEKLCFSSDKTVESLENSALEHAIARLIGQILLYPTGGIPADTEAGAVFMDEVPLPDGLVAKD